MGNNARKCKKHPFLPKIQMLFSENPDVYVKKQVQIRTQ